MNLQELQRKTEAWSKGEEIDFISYDHPLIYKGIPQVLWSLYFDIPNHKGNRKVARYGFLTQ